MHVQIVNKRTQTNDRKSKSADMWEPDDPSRDFHERQAVDKKDSYY